MTSQTEAKTETFTSYYTCCKCKVKVDSNDPGEEYCRYNFSSRGETGRGFCIPCSKKYKFYCYSYCCCFYAKFKCLKCKKTSRHERGTEYCRSSGNGYCAKCAKDNNFICVNDDCACGYSDNSKLS
jgi:hypothetical protein